MCDQPKSAVDACAAGLGLGMFLTYQVMPSIERDDLSVVLEAFGSEPIPVNLVFHHTRLMAHRVRALVDYLSEELKHGLAS